MGNNMGIIIFIISNEKHKEDLKLVFVQKQTRPGKASKHEKSRVKQSQHQTEVSVCNRLLL